ncbi:alpha/beta fold hydrolase [Bradyrhizobium sp. BRP22]|uniref:alpha/beta fold hydrolase n=1 Tax=Bradyrhizobium sp. BRP22 TaxID=2793821 RepID=UPI001CD215D2|nr:alpha/beta fold hydrolase [Bradyrhizobium sp. BRP22]MCA1455932.1 alpha/beta fold hydrolase [Bradyrhizobium sp. BRP22]
MRNSGITRRRMLRSAAAGGLAAAAAPGVIGAARAQSTRKTFVLISGTFCGGWIWRRVADRLEQAGHKVFAPSLTGLAERSHLLSKDINLDTHIADVVNLIQWESLDSVCLVAWSYAGFIGAGALESIGNRVSSIVWLDAFLPTDGQKLPDLSAEPMRNAVQTAVERGTAGFGPPPKWGVVAVAERDQPFVLSRATAHPVGTYLQPVKLSGALEKVAKKTYIRLPKFPQPVFDKALADCKGNKSWVTFELSDVGHMAMLDAPERVSELILQAA